MILARMVGLVRMVARKRVSTNKGGKTVATKKVGLLKDGLEVITGEHFEAMMACKSSRSEFEKVFPRGMRVNVTNLKKCIKAKVDANYLLNHVGRDSDNQILRPSVWTRLDKKRESRQNKCERMTGGGNSGSGCICSRLVLEELIAMITPKVKA